MRRDRHPVKCSVRWKEDVDQSREIWSVRGHMIGHVTGRSARLNWKGEITGHFSGQVASSREIRGHWNERQITAEANCHRMEMQCNVKDRSRKYGRPHGIAQHWKLVTVHAHILQMDDTRVGRFQTTWQKWTGHNIQNKNNAHKEKTVHRQDLVKWEQAVQLWCVPFHALPGGFCVVGATDGAVVGVASAWQSIETWSLTKQRNLWLLRPS